MAYLAKRAQGAAHPAQEVTQAAASNAKALPADAPAEESISMTRS